MEIMTNNKTYNNIKHKNTITTNRSDILTLVLKNIYCISNIVWNIRGFKDEVRYNEKSPTSCRWSCLSLEKMQK